MLVLLARMIPLSAAAGQTAGFVMLAVLGTAAAAFVPDRRWKGGRVLYPLLGIVLSGAAFQHISCSGYERLIELAYLPLMLGLTGVVYAAVWLMAGDLRRAAVICFWLMYACGYIYECILLFRGVGFRPMDVFSFGTALSVAGHYRYPLEIRHLGWAMTGTAFWALGGWIPRERLRTSWARAGKALTVALAAGSVWLMISTSLLSQWKVEVAVFDTYTSIFNRRQGTLATLMKECHQLKNMRPANYDAGLISAASGEEKPQESMQPHVVVIMNEALADLPSVWQMEDARDPLLGMHTLDAMQGWVYVSAFGGSTCNTEHSFLTSTMPAPMLDMPLLSTVREETPSLAWQLKADGYTAIGIHPYIATNYQRNTVYPKLGFDRFVSEAEFAGAETVRSFVTDAACYEKLISLYEQREAGEKLFLFTVTMQNHGPYDDCEKPLDSYLELVRRSDEALMDLIGYFDAQQEPVVLLIFGDHQPCLEMEGYAPNEALTPLQRDLARYMTPLSHLGQLSHSCRKREGRQRQLSGSAAFAHRRHEDDGL